MHFPAAYTYLFNLSVWSWWNISEDMLLVIKSWSEDSFNHVKSEDQHLSPVYLLSFAKFGAIGAAIQMAH